MAVPLAAPGEEASKSKVLAPETLRVRVGGRVERVSIEDYVLGSALSEVSPVGESPAAVSRIFEVQAVLARTYAAANRRRHSHEGFDLCDTTHCQRYEPSRIGPSRFTAAARAAVQATRGRVLAFGSRVARVLFHADCGGHTSAADAVWRGDRVSYLVGAPDDADVEHREWSFTASLDMLQQALNAHRDTSVGKYLQSVVVRERDASGRATRVEVRGAKRRVMTSEKFRAVVNAVYGPKALLSTLFDITPTAAGFEFRGAGYGHGVGLCQVGAAARARRGDSLLDILAAYFPGAKLR